MAGRFHLTATPIALERGGRIFRGRTRTASAAGTMDSSGMSLCKIGMASRRKDDQSRPAAHAAPVVWMPGPCAGLSSRATAVWRLFPPASRRRAPALLLADGGRTPNHPMFIRRAFQTEPARRYVAIAVETPGSSGATASRRRGSHGLAGHWIGRCPSCSDEGTASDRSRSTFATGAAMKTGTDRGDDRQAIHESPTGRNILFPRQNASPRRLEENQGLISAALRQNAPCQALRLKRVRHPARRGCVRRARCPYSKERRDTGADHAARVSEGHPGAN